MRENKFMRDLKWSASEKAIARRAFDHARDAELRELVQKTKEKAAATKDWSELWNLESWLTKKRLEIDRQYDYRYSVLPLVFVALLREGRITVEDLNALAPDKIVLIVNAASRL